MSDINIQEYAPEWQDEYKLIEPIKIDGELSAVVKLFKPKRKHFVEARKAKTVEDQDNALISYCTNLSPVEVMELDQLDYEGIQLQLAPFFTRFWDQK